MSRRIPLFPLPGRRAAARDAAAPPHLRAPLPRDGRRRARGRPHDRHGDAEAGRRGRARTTRRSTAIGRRRRDRRVRGARRTAATTSSSRRASASACSTRTPPDPYRVARVEESAGAVPRARRRGERSSPPRRRLFGEVARELDLPPLPSEALSPERLASEIALRLRYAPPELQALLETDSLAARFETLAGRMLEWKEPARLPRAVPAGGARLRGTIRHPSLSARPRRVRLEELGRPRDDAPAVGGSPACVAT